MAEAGERPGGKRAEKREELRARILAAAEARIVSAGVESLRARDVMADVGAALGGLYNAFADLDDLVLHVNSRTLQRLRADMEEAEREAASPPQALRALALRYLAFAEENRALWSALFEHRFAAGREIPEWHLAEQAELLTHIARPLRELQPRLSPDGLALRARTLFGAIHGIVATSLAGRFVGVSGEDLEAEITAFVDLVVEGMGRSSPS